MRRYDDPVEVRRGMVAGPGGTQEGPEQFLWRGRLWKVCDVMAHWVETGAWWRSRGAGAVLGAETEDAAVGGASVAVGVGAGAGGVAARTGWSGSPEPSASGPAVSGPSVSGPSVSGDLLAEREVWRVEAARGLAAARAVGPDGSPGGGRGVFDLTFDWADGSWRLTRCAD
jgi:hypothetical protein